MSAARPGPEPDPDREIPEGMDPRAAESWPSQTLIDSFLDQFDFEVEEQTVPLPADS